MHKSLTHIFPIHRTPQARPGRRDPPRRLVLRGREGESRRRFDYRGDQACHVSISSGDAEGEADPRLQAAGLQRRERPTAETQRADGGLLVPIQNGNKYIPERQNSPLRQGRRHEGRHLHLPPAGLLLHPARVAAGRAGAADSSGLN